MAPEIPITIARGATFEFGILYADEDLLYLPITGMPSKAPVRLTVVGHGVPDGWPVRVACVKAPEELNTAADEWVFAHVVDADTIELNNLNAHCWRAFSGSGLLILRRPADLAGWQCRAQVRDRVGGQLLFSWHSDPAENPDSLVLVDVALSQFVLTMSDTQSEALTWSKGVYEAEVIAPGGQVYKLTAISPITVSREVTK
ncbi:hypothetical protein [Aquipseudomonas campi]